VWDLEIECWDIYACEGPEEADKVAPYFERTATLGFGNQEDYARGLYDPLDPKSPKVDLTDISLGLLTCGLSLLGLGIVAIDFSRGFHGAHTVQWALIISGCLLSVSAMAAMVTICASARGRRASLLLWALAVAVALGAGGFWLVWHR
jgi:hypothetical protein